MTGERVYLDHNATTPIGSEARDAMLAALDLVGNPSSVHREGRRARALVDRARDGVARLAGAEPREIVFASGASEANAAVLAGRAWAHVLASAIEHPSLGPSAGQSGQRLEIPVDSEGQIDLDFVRRVLPVLDGPDDRILVTVQSANGETGVLQDITALVTACRAIRPGVFIHTDAVQAAGRLPLAFRALGVDAMTLSSHKLGGPVGAGALVLREGLDLKPLIAGGGQERGQRGGTENVAAIAGFGAAAEVACSKSADWGRVGQLRDRMEAEFLNLTPEALIISRGAPRLSNTTSIAVPGTRAETSVIRLDLAGFAVSAGSACSSGRVSRSPALTAMGLPPALADGALRISLGLTTTEAEITRFLGAWPGFMATRAHISDSPPNSSPEPHRARAAKENAHARR